MDASRTNPPSAISAPISSSRKPRFPQNLSAMFAESRRVLPDRGWRLAPGRGGAGDAQGAFGRVLDRMKQSDRGEMRVVDQAVEVVHRRMRDVGLVEERHPLRRGAGLHHLREPVVDEVVVSRAGVDAVEARVAVGLRRVGRSCQRTRSIACRSRPARRCSRRWSGRGGGRATTAANSLRVRSVARSCGRTCGRRARTEPWSRTSEFSMAWPSPVRSR